MRSYVDLCQKQIKAAPLIEVQPHLYEHTHAIFGRICSKPCHCQQSLKPTNALSKTPI